MPITRESVARNSVERSIAAVMARVPDRAGLRAVADLPGGIGDLALPLVGSHSPYLSLYDAAATINALLSRVANQPFPSLSPTYRRLNGVAEAYTRTGVNELLDTYGERLPYEVADGLTGVIVGTGPGGIIAGRTLSEIGIKNLTYVSPDIRIGGIWSPDGPWGQDKRIGYNNPRAIEVYDAHLELPSSRRTRNMQRFLSTVAGQDMATHHTQGTVIGAEFDGQKHTVHFQDPSGKEKILTADFVLVATGNHVLPLEASEDAGYFKLENTKDVTVKRWPSLLSNEEITRLHEKDQVVLCVGWGNSTMAKLREIEDINASRGTHIRAVVLSHFSDFALNNPHTPTLQPDGKLRTVSRDPAIGEYTKLELDLPESRRLFYRSLPKHIDSTGAVTSGTISDVINCSLFTAGGITNARVVTRDEYGRENVSIIQNIGEVDAFTGFGNDPRLMEALGFEVTDTYRGIVNTRPFDGRAVNTDHDGNLHAVGTTAYTRENPSVRVIPGIIPQAAEVALTVATYAARRYAEQQRTRRFERQRAQISTLEKRVLHLIVSPSTGADKAYEYALSDNPYERSDAGPAMELMDLLLQLRSEGADRTNNPVLATFTTQHPLFREQRALASALCDLGTHLRVPISIDLSNDEFPEIYNSGERPVSPRFLSLLAATNQPEQIINQRKAVLSGIHQGSQEPVIKLKIRPKPNPNPRYDSEQILNEVVLA